MKSKQGTKSLQMIQYHLTKGSSLMKQLKYNLSKNPKELLELDQKCRNRRRQHQENTPRYPRKHKREEVARATLAQA